MGIDAGLTGPGFAVVDCRAGFPGQVLLAEQFKPKGNKKDHKSKTAFDVDRIAQITTRELEIYNQYKPTVIIAELPTGGARSAGGIRGMAFAVANVATLIPAIVMLGSSLEVCYISPTENKRGATGRIDVRSDSDEECAQRKWEMVAAADHVWQGIPWPKKKRKSLSHELDDGQCWAAADALGCILTYLRNKQHIPKFTV